MRIDAHQHFWNYDSERFDWITDDMAELRRDFLPEDLYPILQTSQIDGCIAVQAEEHLRETEFLLELSETYPWILGVVGWVELAQDNLDELLDTWSSNSKLLGFREVLQSKEPEYMLRKDFIRGIRKIGQRGYTYDLLTYPHQLSAALKLVDSCPNQAFVIDHLSKPEIKGGDWKAWKKSLQPFSERELVCAKVSGLVTEADWKRWNSSHLFPYLEIALELFGPKRLLFGSDWPVCLVAGDYKKVVGVIESFADQLSGEEKDAVLGENAQEFYKI
ncbi:MAG: amidohydrolase family protein [Bacteroidetes bacterium]|nr:amidohydrolase family protein [Bacteroidota bacterium]